MSLVADMANRELDSETRGAIVILSRPDMLLHSGTSATEDIGQH